MAHLTAAELRIARRRGREFRATHPHAKSARYDRKSDSIIIELESGATFTFSPRVVEGLAEATSEQLGDIELLGDGFGDHWDQLDVDYTVPGLVNGIFGTARWSVGMKQSERRSAMDVVLVKQAELLALWREIQGERG